MKVCVALEQRFVGLPDGSIWTQAHGAWAFWRRYLDVFDEVRCLARVRPVRRLEGEWHRADGPRVSFAIVPYYVGVREFLRNVAGVRAAVGAAMRSDQAVILRLPGIIGHLAARSLRAARHPYAVEVVGDPYAAFAPGAVRHPLRGLLRRHLRQQLKHDCAHACAASYVNAGVLPIRYPCPGPTIVASSIELPDHVIATSPRHFASGARVTKLVFVGSLEQYYKAPDVLIRSLAECLRRGLSLHLTMVGDGRHRAALEALATELGCRDRVRFPGQVAGGSQVFGELDNADVFVLPSRSEGLPRAMLEAMARGLPCIGSDAGGIPELLPAEARVPAGDAHALAAKICEVVQDPDRMTRMSACNLQLVKSYRSTLLQARRVGFYRGVHAATVTWRREHGLAPSLPGPAPSCRDSHLAEDLQDVQPQ
jgi:glycosyltransferase involved in cell wall biosynthesis